MVDYTILSDHQLIVLLRERDQIAFKEVYERYWALLFNHARRMLKDDEQAEDVVQDIFLILLNKPESLQLESSLSSYLYQTVRNKILNLIRHEKVKVDYIRSFQDYFSTGVYSTDDMVREREMNQRIDREIARLPAKMRKMFELSRQTPLTYKEIAEHTATSEGTVRKQVYYALKILRSKLSSFFL